MKLLPLTALRAFDAVFRHRAFHAAATELNVTPSAISHQIRHLEEWFGTNLIERNGRQIKFTPGGAALAGTLRLAFADIETACQALRRKTAKPQLTVAVIPSVAICWLIPRLPLFRAIAPNVELKIMYAIFGQDLNYEDIDLAIICARRKPEIPGFETADFLSGASAPVCSQAFAQLHPHLKEAADIAACSLLHDTDTSGWRSWLGDEYPPQAEGAADIIFEDFNLLRVAVLAGQGIALCPPDLIRDDLQAGRLVQLSERVAKNQLNYYVVRRAGAEQEPINLLFNWLQDMAHHAG
ncbi:LysR substrate-binding domain-containing protein [Acidocella sp. KAb 2-4]|uniref:LysR substrate-binding domain-containing protein n=1 Tax=Acidocella sp. KAb 2-4 TaxID=2885158 RepID=UPI001D09276E|nr:LysR substrate-binding domain-containing protein [Acidocella sp. KAb 2-4]MCB5945575.1 LysR family transcriptional regulator [Acidocella sp. KAb 2-4]